MTFAQISDCKICGTYYYNSNSGKEGIIVINKDGNWQNYIVKNGEEIPAYKGEWEQDDNGITIFFLINKGKRIKLTSTPNAKDNMYTGKKGDKRFVVLGNRYFYRK